MPDIAKVSGVAEASIAKIDGVVKANIASVSGISVPAGTNIVTANLIQHWDFSNTSFYSGSGTSLTDLSDVTHSGSLQNGAAFTGTSPEHITLDGINDYAEVEIASTYGQDQSGEAWVQFPDYSTTKRILFVRGYKSNCVTTNAGYWFQVNTSKQILYTIGDVSNYSSSVQSLSINTWYCMGWTLNGSQLKIFLNGSNVSTLTVSTTRYSVCSTTPPQCRTGMVTLNTGAVGSVFSNGKLAELRIYSTNLSDSEMLGNFDATKAEYGYGDIVETDLVINLDAGNSNSYSGSGTTWSNLVSGTSFDFTLTNGPVYTADQGGYFQFDGINDYATKTSLFNMADYPSFSIESWVYADNSSSDHSICGQWQNSPSGYGPGILYLDVGDGAVGWDWIVRLSDGTNKRIGTRTANGSVGAWNHVVATFNSTQMQLYVNNSLIGTVSTGDTIDDNTNEGLAIGADRDTGGRYMDGKISIFRFYEKVLSSTEIAQNYNAIKGRYGL